MKVKPEILRRTAKQLPITSIASVSLIQSANYIEELEEKLIAVEQNKEPIIDIDEFLYEMCLNDKEQIPCVIKVDGVERKFVITEKDVRAFSHLFKMHKMKQDK